MTHKARIKRLFDAVNHRSTPQGSGVLIVEYNADDPSDPDGEKAAAAAEAEARARGWLPGPYINMVMIARTHEQNAAH